MASQTLMSLSRPTEAAVRQIGFTGAAHEGMVTHIGLATLLLRPLHSQILGYAHRFWTRSFHAHKTRKRFCHFRWFPKRRSHNHRIPWCSWSCTFTNSAVTYSGRIRSCLRTQDSQTLLSRTEDSQTPCHALGSHKRSRHVRWTPRCSCHNAGLTDAFGRITLDWLHWFHKRCYLVGWLLVGLRWIGWIDYTGFTNAAISLVGYWLVYIELVGLSTPVSQTLLSRSRWTLRRYYPYHRPTEAAVRQLDSQTHERMVTLIGLADAPVANPALANLRIRTQGLYTFLSRT